MNIELEVNPNRVLEAIGEEYIREWIEDNLTQQELEEFAKDILWDSEESKYEKYHQSNLLNQQKLDLFINHIDNVSLEDVEKLVKSKF